MPHRITLHDLRMLLSKSDRNLLLELNSAKFGFETFLEKGHYASLSENAVDVLAMVVQILSNACSPKSRHVGGLIRKLLRMITECKKFLFEDILEVIHSCFAKRQGVDLIQFMSNYMTILHSILKFNLICDEVTDVAFPALQNYMNRVKEMRMKNQKEAEVQFDKLKNSIERYERMSDPSYDEADVLGNFRQLSIVPRSNDIINCEISKLPCNIIDGPYENVNHFLSVHYRLMREDMLRCFRLCIKSCLSSDRGNAARSKNRIYDSVRVGYPPEYTPYGMFYNIKVTSESEMDWTKREILMPGNLLCLTPDNFRSVVFASVRQDPKSDKGASRECRLMIKLEDDLYVDDLDSNVSYLMIEPDAYFECYKHVLSAIKEFSEGNFPLADIITYLDYGNTEPEYINGLSYCLHEKCENGSEESLEKDHPCKIFRPLEFEEWPTAEELKFDDQQYEAFKLALTKNVAVIQGPPGTGKTFIGVKVVKALLDNVPRKPIIVSCLTNHALDQFLERILEHTKSVVRLGSQSKSQKLEPHTMDNLTMALRWYADNEKNKSAVMHNVLEKSLNIISSFAPELLGTKFSNEYDEQYIALKVECKKLNKNMRSLSLCQDKFLDVDALNYIVDDKYKEQLRKGHESRSHKNLVTCVMEWFACSHLEDLYKKCEKQFGKIKQKHNIHNSNLWALTESERYYLFHSWRENCLSKLRSDVEYGIENYKKIMRNYHKSNLNFEKMALLAKADVIGVTTTGASKFRNLIKNVRPRILVVEEAAQVLESHIIAALAESTQHLILIGDHKQLRPLPADDELAKKYRLNISMFERLFENKAPSATLVTQHRMKPCIAELLVPEIYESLDSFSNVYEYEDIRGVKSSVFFLDHSMPENENSSSVSSSNNYEAKMIISLTKYFLAQSYLPDQITILAAYAAQVNLIYGYLIEESLEVKVTTVDNYQGEENDIILVSYVRSNSSVIGYLKESTRVCVSLSRARKGFFCLGNFKLYSDKSELWKSLVDKLNAQNMIGESLPIECTQHKKISSVKTPEEVLNFIDKGCSQACDFVLPCGHVCARKCHFDDASHSRYRCIMPCGKYIDETRVCSRLCYQPCKKAKKKTIELPCGHSSKAVNLDSMFNSVKCEVEMQKCLPCNHIVTVPCHVDPATFPCKALIPVVLPCGHKKNVPCCNRNNIEGVVCYELRPQRGPCEHIIDVPCHLNFDENEILQFCSKSCDKLLSCGHPCVGCCRWCFDIGIHAYCTSKCDLKLPCGHSCEGYCHSPCVPCKKKCFITCDHDTRCINPCLRPCIECPKPCARKCRHVKCSKLCFQECDVEPCTEACIEKLPCGHSCIGLCGDPCPYLCRVCNKEDLKCKNPEKDRFVMLTDCDHIIELNELSEHIEDCIECFDWPYCPVCSTSLTKSLRYKIHLQKAKTYALKVQDVSEEVSTIQYHLNSMYGDNYVIPARFLEVHKSIAEILNLESPSPASVLVLKTIVLCLGQMVILSKMYHLDDAQSSNEHFRNRFVTLLIWISNHLTYASHQQLRELKLAIKELFSWHSALSDQNSSTDAKN